MAMRRLGQGIFNGYLGWQVGLKLAWGNTGCKYRTKFPVQAVMRWRPWRHGQCDLCNLCETFVLAHVYFDVVFERCFSNKEICGQQPGDTDDND